MYNMYNIWENMPSIDTTIRDEVLDLIHKKGGTLYQGREYKNASTTLHIICGNGHDFYMLPSGIRVHSWCKYCGINQDPNYEYNEVLRIIALRQYTLISSNGRNIKLRCSNNHEFDTNITKLINGVSCKLCCKNSINNGMDNFYRMIQLKGGILEDDFQYTNSEQSCRILCNAGHIWETNPCKVNAGYWCYQCCGNSKEKGIRSMMEVINRKGGQLLSEYSTTEEKVKVLCSKGHEFYITPHDIVGDYWCNRCNESKGERSISEYLDSKNIQYIKEYVPKGYKWRYDFLIYYNNKHYLVEYDGEQHFKYIKRFHTDMNTFYNKIKVDYEKTLLSINMRIPLLRISYKEKDIILDLMNKFLQDYITMYSNPELYHETWSCILQE